MLLSGSQDGDIMTSFRDRLRKCVGCDSGTSWRLEVSSRALGLPPAVSAHWPTDSATPDSPARLTQSPRAAAANQRRLIWRAEFTQIGRRC